MPQNPHRMSPGRLYKHVVLPCEHVVLPWEHVVLPWKHVVLIWGHVVAGQQGLLLYYICSTNAVLTHCSTNVVLTPGISGNFRKFPEISEISGNSRKSPKCCTDFPAASRRAKSLRGRRRPAVGGEFGPGKLAVQNGPLRGAG